MTNAKTPGARCYGFVTLSSAEDANRSIENLHKTELHGRVISVERVRFNIIFLIKKVKFFLSTLITLFTG